MRRFEGKTAVVAGGGTGIGRAAAERPVEEGAHVFIMGRRRAGSDETAAAIGADSVTVVAGDISRLADTYGASKAAVRAWSNELRDSFGGENQGIHLS